MSTLHIASRRDYRWWQVLTWAPHRVMFAAGAIQGTLALAGWFQDLLADYTGWYRPLELNIPEAWAHGYLMVYGFFPFFMFGFLMTALPNWVGQEKPTAGNYVPSAGLMFLGVTLFYAGMLLFEPLIYLGVALQLGGWLVGLSGLVRRVRAAQGQDLRHPLLAILAMTVGAMGLLVFNFAMVAHEPWAARLSLWAGVWMFLLPVFLTSVLGGGPAALGVIEGIAESTASFLKLFSGDLSDRVRRRKSWVVAGYTISNIIRPLIAVAGSWLQVLPLRFSDRLGKGLRTSPRDAMIADSTPLEFRGMAYGFHRAMDHGGAIVGPLLATGLLLLFHDRIATVFLLSFIPGTLAVQWKASARPGTSPARRPWSATA